MQTPTVQCPLQVAIASMNIIRKVMNTVMKAGIQCDSHDLLWEPPTERRVDSITTTFNANDQASSYSTTTQLQTLLACIMTPIQCTITSKHYSNNPESNYSRTHQQKEAHIHTVRR